MISNSLGFNIFSPDSRPYGLSYGEWTVMWWQWITSIPREESPGNDKTGTNCQRNQSGPIWFLVGTFEDSQSAQRECTVCRELAIMFPIIVSEKSYIECPMLSTESELAEKASESQDRVENMYVVIDDVTLSNFDEYRIRSPPFILDLPENNILGVKSGKTTSISEGYWIILEGLQPGKHNMKFGGETYYDNRLEFKTDVTYDLTIKDRA